MAAEQQYYVSLADSFGSILDDLAAIEVTEQDHSTATARSSIECQGKQLEFALDALSSPRKKQKMSTQKSNIEAAQHEQKSEVVEIDANINVNNTKKAGGKKWQKLRSSVQRVMTEIQEEKKKKQIISLGPRRTGTSSNMMDVSTSNDAIAFHLQAQEEDQFQQVLLVKSNSTCSTSTECSEYGSSDDYHQGRNNAADNTSNHRRQSSIDPRRQPNEIIANDDELSPIEEGAEDEDDLVFSSSEEGTNNASSISTRQGHSTQINNGTRSLRAQLEDALFALEIANKEKKVLQGQLDATSFRLGKMRKTIQQRSMENSKLNEILDGKNATLAKQNKQLGILDLALKQSQEKNEKLMRELDQLRRQQGLPMPPSRKLSLVHVPLPSPPVNHTGTRTAGPSSATVRERVSVFATAPINIGAASSSGNGSARPSPAESVANAFKEGKRFFSNQSSSDAKQNKAYLKLSGTDEENNSTSVTQSNVISSNKQSQSNIRSFNDSAAHPRPNTDEGIISAMARKFSNWQVDGREDCSTARNELEAIRQNHLQGKVRGSKSSLEVAFQPPKSPRIPVSGFFSPLSARIDLLGLESSCAGPLEPHSE